MSQQNEEHETEQANVQPEDQVEEVQPDEFASEIAALQLELDQLQKDAVEAHDRYLRTLADFDNFRKRQREETLRLTNLAREDVFLKLLPIIDNLERSIQAADAQHSYEVLVEGVSLTLKQLLEMLQREGVEPIEAVGQVFNPEQHEAMMCCETDEYPEDTIVDEIEKGYIYKDKVLRPSRVRVAKPC